MGTSTLPPGGYTPAQISRAYGFDTLISSGGNGSNRTIAIIVAYGSPTVRQDLSVFCAQFGLPAANLSVVTPSGAPSTVDSGWAAETMLDVEWAHAMAPAAKILLVVAPDATYASLAACIQYASGKADVVSMSWGGAERPADPSLNSLFSNPSVSFVAASGDTGAGVNWPASSPSVLAVGGTSLVLNSLGSVASETAWSDSGGGVSSYQLIPSYQLGWSAGSGRSVPDVSFLADPYTGIYVYMTDPRTRAAGWVVYGGTSAGCPQWAALLADRRSLVTSSGSLSNTSLYKTVAKTSSGGFYTQNSSILRDISSPQLPNPAEPYIAYPPTAGFDLATGLGSPIAGSVASINTTPTPTPTPTPTQSRSLKASNFQSAVTLMNTLNLNFAMDAQAGRPGGQAFLTDNRSVLTSQQALAKINQGTPVYLDFSGYVQTPSQLALNPRSWLVIQPLSYQATTLLLQVGWQRYPVYQLSLN